MSTPTIHNLTREAQAASLRLEREQRRVAEISLLKQQRQALDLMLQSIKENHRLPFSAGLTNAAHYTRNAIMWLGVALEELNDQNPYPNGNNVASPQVDPRADRAGQ